MGNVYSIIKSFSQSAKKFSCLITSWSILDKFGHVWTNLDKFDWFPISPSLPWKAFSRATAESVRLPKLSSKGPVVLISVINLTKNRWNKNDASFLKIKAGSKLCFSFGVDSLGFSRSDYGGLCWLHCPQEMMFEKMWAVEEWPASHYDVLWIILFKNFI